MRANEEAMMTKDRSQLHLMPVVVPPGTSYDDEAQRWASIPPEWQEEMVALYERWLRSEEYATDAKFRQRIHVDIAADAAENSISPPQAAYLRALMVIVVPKGTTWADFAQRWESVMPAWQQENTIILERWVRQSDDRPYPMTLQEVGLIIRDYIADGSVTAEQGECLREIFRTVQQEQRTAKAKATPAIDPEVAAIFA